MKKANKTLVILVVVTVFTLILSSCHRNTCPTWNKVDTSTDVRS